MNNSKEKIKVYEHNIEFDEFENKDIDVVIGILKNKKQEAEVSGADCIEFGTVGEWDYYESCVVIGYRQETDGEYNKRVSELREKIIKRNAKRKEHLLKELARIEEMDSD